MPEMCPKCWKEDTGVDNDHGVCKCLHAVFDYEIAHGNSVERVEMRDGLGLAQPDGMQNP